jgi:hypothetical protein
MRSFGGSGFLMGALALGACLMAAPLALALQNATTNPPAHGTASGAKSHAKALEPARAMEPFRITVRFKKLHGAKVTTQKDYMVLATSGGILPLVRDDARYRTNPTEPREGLSSNTDMDILELRREGDRVYVALKISTQTFTLDAPEELLKLPVEHTHQYLISPTVVLGKLTTVYAATDSVHDIRVELQLLVERQEDAGAALQ